MDDREFQSVKCGNPPKIRGYRQFLENDRKVLRFYAYWDDKTRYGARWYFTVHYYLADETVEISNEYARGGSGSGKWQVASFLKRQKLELNPTTVIAPGMVKAPSPHLVPSDLEIGRTFPVYGRELFLYDADEATYKFYRDYMGKEMTKIKIPEESFLNAAQDAVGVHKTLQPPPWNGLGGMQDTLNGCKQVTERKPPHRDFTRLMLHGNKALRFEAVPALERANVPEDAHRKFVIEYFLADNTILVGDKHVRNSGCWDGGKFKERDLPGGERRTTNPDTGKFFEAEEFVVGNIVKILCMPMKITRADEWSLKYMETDPETFPQSAIHLILPKLAAILDWEGKLPNEIPVDQFEDAVYARIRVQLTEMELITILRHCGDPDTANIRFDKICELLRSPPGPPKRPIQPGDPIPEVAAAA
jgi:hypothetical protein